MSANVWYEEVERGLIQEILNTVKYLDSTGSVTPITEDMVFIRDPEEDLKDEVFPCVTITQLFDIFDSRRYNPNSVVVSRDYENGTAEVQESAIPFNLTYQIDFWSRYKEDINLMTKTWLQSHFKQFNLSVVDDGGTQRSCNTLMNESLKSSNLLVNQKRLYHSIISYTIWVEMDEEISYTVNMVTKTDIVSGNK